MNIIVTGGRDYKDRDKVFKVLKMLNPKYIIIGDCPTGVDKFVNEYCDVNFIGNELHFAYWEKYGLKAGPLRNIEMIKQNPDAIVIAFPGGKGTQSCINEALARGLVVLKVDE